MKRRHSTAYAVDLKAAGIKDRELAKRLETVSRLDRQHVEAFADLEQARAAAAATDDEIEAQVAEAALAGDDLPAISELRAERDAALHAAERTEAGVRAARDRAIRDLEHYVGNHAADLRSQVRPTVEKRLAALEEARAAYFDALRDATGALTALLWCQGMPTAGKIADPAADRALLAKIYDQHPAVTRAVQALREVDAALEAPTDGQFVAARETSKRGYLHDPTRAPKAVPTLTQADLAGARS